MFKWWRRINPTPSRRPKGFILEILLSMHGPIAETHYGEAFAQTLENIHGAYAYGASLNSKPTIADPAVSGNDILAKVTVPQWKVFIEKVRVYADIARRAQDEDDMEEATKQWRQCLWRTIQVDGQRRQLLPSTADLATAVAPSAGYTFPSNPAAPPSKPRGFA